MRGRRDGEPDDRPDRRDRHDFHLDGDGGHRPRVKYFPQPGRSQPSFSVSIADSPAVLANSLPIRVLRQMSPQVIAWVSRNKDALLDFWYHGDTRTQPEVNAFVQTLQRV
jgi:hypothetical protein